MSILKQKIQNLKNVSKIHIFFKLIFAFVTFRNKIKDTKQMGAIIDAIMTIGMVGIMLFIIIGYYVQKHGVNGEKDDVD